MNARQFFEVWQAAVSIVWFVRSHKATIPSELISVLERCVTRDYGAKVGIESGDYARRLLGDVRGMK